MPLEIKFKTQQDRGAERLWLTDLTGEYSAVVGAENLGGYGVDGIPNPDLNQLCLVAIVQRNASSGSELLEGIPTTFKRIEGAVNEDSFVFELIYINDGWHSMNLVALPVSDNQTTDLNGQTIAINEHYYYPFANKIYKKIDQFDPLLDIPVEEEDYVSILDQTTNLHTTRCEDMFLSALSVARETEYQEYRATRKGICEPSSQFNSNRELTEDIISADLTFRSGLMIQSQDQVEVVLDERNL